MNVQTAIDILLVEDSRADAALVTRVLGNESSQRFHVQSVGRLDEAIDILSSQSFDTILVDLSLPDAQGLEALDAINKLATDSPIVILTGVDDEQIALEAVRQGAQDYLIKGSDTTRMLLARSIHYAIERKRSEQQVRQLNAELEDRVARRTKQLATANEDLKREMTERTQAEDALRRAERLVSIGTMAAGIAHEINNPIAAVLNAAEAAQRFKNDPEAAHRLDQCLDNVVRSAERCREIVSNVLKFARQEPAERKLCDINDTVRSAVDTAGPDAEDQHASLQLELSPSLPHVWINSIGIEQVLVNLIHNAIQSAQEKLIVTIRTEPIEGGVRIVVEDNGSGMAEEQKQRAFDPFYSTRHNEGGTGLGLSIAHGIVEGHCGEIEIHSNVGQGTIVSVSLPIGAEDV